MYKSFFGFHERPFKLVPDPTFFFLGSSHEEALAHLAFAIRQGEGFILIIGEVGTGKTTLCRQFLENLEESIETAYIFNPTLEPVDLLKTINQELGIPSSDDEPRKLINHLNAYLLEKKQQGHRVILLIDEAQSLSFDVLEQLRLLSNLETTRSKLIQIVLVGQPELNNLLGSYKLRQLGQRVSITCQLVPLSQAEMQDYIDYRTTIASGKATTLFSPGALREIYQFSEGTPRLINIICDRALLVAFIQNQKRVSAKIVRLAASELRGPADRRSFLDFIKLRWLWALFLVGLLALIGFLAVPKMVATGKSKAPSALSRLIIKPIKAPKAVTRPEPAPPRLAMPLIVPTNQRVASATADRSSGGITLKQLSVVNPMVRDTTQQRPEANLTGVTAFATSDDLNRLLADMDPAQSRQAALTVILKLWLADPEIPEMWKAWPDDWKYFRHVTEFNGFEIHRTRNDASLITRMDLPAIMVFDYTNGKRYLACLKWQDNVVVLTDGQRKLKMSTAHLNKSEWSGAYIPWRNFLKIRGTIPGDASHETTLTFKMLLRKKGFTLVPLNAEYDDATKDAVEIIQARGGIPVDGVVGPVTKIIIYNDLREYRTPHIGADPKGLG